MRFDFCIGNPPYQDERQGDSNTATPVYHLFVSVSYESADKVMLGQHERLVSRIEKAEAEKKDRKDRARKIELYMGLLERQDDELDFDPGLFALFVDKVIVCGTKRDVQLRFILADGSEWEV